MPNDPTSPVELIKRAALAAVEASKPLSVQFGTVISDAPLQIITDQKMELEAADLVLARHVTDYEIDMTVDHLTEQETEHIHEVIDTFSGGGTSLPTQHLHAYLGRKTFLVHNALRAGEKVILLRMQGSTKYLVIDRVGVMG